jgi:hypothetical protein
MLIDPTTLVQYVVPNILTLVTIFGQSIKPIGAFFRTTIKTTANRMSLSQMGSFLILTLVHDNVTSPFISGSSSAANQTRSASFRSLEIVQLCQIPKNITPNDKTAERQFHSLPVQSHRLNWLHVVVP